MNWYPFVGLFVGALLSWGVPYVRVGLERVKETGNFADWPKFDGRYVALTFYPLFFIAVSILTERGAWDAIKELDFISAVLLTYAGGRFGNEIIKGIRAIF